MIIIHHRINRLENISSLNKDDGAEIDVRYHCNDLILHHDPFEHHIRHPILLESFLEQWNCNGPLILNLKTEGIEEDCINLMRKFNVENWFFLDMSMPFFVKYSMLTSSDAFKNFSSENLAVRYSDFEPIDYAISFAGRVSWLWIDTFKKFPLDSNIVKVLNDLNFKICIVSPELHNHSVELIQEMRSTIKTLNLTVDAVCTKYPQAWN